MPLKRLAARSPAHLPVINPGHVFHCTLMPVRVLCACRACRCTRILVGPKFICVRRSTLRSNSRNVCVKKAQSCFPVSFALHLLSHVYVVSNMTGNQLMPASTFFDNNEVPSQSSSSGATTSQASQSQGALTATNAAVTQGRPSQRRARDLHQVRAPAETPNSPPRSRARTDEPVHMDEDNDAHSPR